MLISEVIVKLNKLKELHGDVEVAVVEPDDYWGHLHHRVTDSNIEFNSVTQPDGPKSGKSIPAVVIGY